MSTLPPRLRARLSRCSRLLSLILVGVLLSNTLLVPPQSARAAQSAPSMAADRYAAASGASATRQPPTINAATPSCDLYPIALHTQSLTGVAAGDTIADIANGTQPGNFGWLTWSGSHSVPSLVASLTRPATAAAIPILTPPPIT